MANTMAPFYYLVFSSRSVSVCTGSTKTLASDYASYKLRAPLSVCNIAGAALTIVASNEHCSKDISEWVVIDRKLRRNSFTGHDGGWKNCPTDIIVRVISGTQSHQ